MPKQLPTQKDQRSDQKAYLQKLVDRRRWRYLLNCFNRQIPASPKQLPTHKDQCSDQKPHLQKLVNIRRSGYLLNRFNWQYPHRRNSCQRRKISVLIKSHTSKNWLFGAAASRYLLNCFNRRYLRLQKSWQQSQISYLLEKDSFKNWLIEAEAVVCSTASMDNTCVDQTAANRPHSAFRSKHTRSTVVWSI